MNLARSLAESLDPVKLAEQAGISLDDWQQELVRAVLVEGEDRALVLACRQAGKSSELAVIGLIRAMEGGTALIVSPSLRQSSETFRKAMGYYRRLRRRPVEPELESQLRAEFEGGGRLVSLPGGEGGDNVRAFTVDLLLLDEAARIPDTVYASTRPMVSVSRGAILAASTPNGSRGWFHSAWTGPERWKRIEVPASRVPRLTPDILREEREALGSFWFDQEYLLRWHDSGAASWFDPQEFRECIDEGREPWF